MRRRFFGLARVQLESDQLTGHVGALLDDMLDLHVEWRERASLSRAAYGRWCDAPALEAELRFGAYCAALDQEESAALAYAAVVRELTRWLWR